MDENHTDSGGADGRVDAHLSSDSCAANGGAGDILDASGTYVSSAPYEGTTTRLTTTSLAMMTGMMVI